MSAFLFLILFWQSVPCPDWLLESNDPVPAYSTGQTVSFRVFFKTPISAVSWYRKTGALTTPSLLLSNQPVLPGATFVDFEYKMPSGTTKQYRVFGCGKNGAEFLECSNDMRFNRK